MVLEAFLISLTSSSQGCKPHVFGLSSCIALLITNIVGVRYHDSTIINCSLPLPYGHHRLHVGYRRTSTRNGKKTGQRDTTRSSLA